MKQYTYGNISLLYWWENILKKLAIQKFIYINIYIYIYIFEIYIKRQTCAACMKRVMPKSLLQVEPADGLAWRFSTDRRLWCFHQLLLSNNAKSIKGLVRWHAEFSVFFSRRYECPPFTSFALQSTLSDITKSNVSPAPRQLLVPDLQLPCFHLLPAEHRFQQEAEEFFFSPPG